MDNKEEKEDKLDELLDIIDKRIGKPPSFINIITKPAMEETNWHKSRL